MKAQTGRDLYRTLLQGGMKTASIIVLAIMLSACEEVVQLDLDSAAPRLVIESVLDAGLGTCAVRISMTSDYYSTRPINTVSGATVTLSVNGGVARSLTDSGNGSYGAAGIAVKSGDRVLLTVTAAGGASYTALAIAPPKVVLDSVTVQKQTSRGMGAKENQYQVFAVWNDEAAVENYYRLKITVNDTVQSDLYTLLDDELLDGQVFRQSVSGNRLQLDDAVIIELLSVDRVYYEYFRQYAPGKGPMAGSATLYNPQGNFGGSVLGYFGVVYRSHMAIQVR